MRAAYEKLMMMLLVMFGVYLIHDNRIVRPLLWKRIFENARYQNSLKIIPYSIDVAAFVFVVCTLVELLRQRVFSLIIKSR